MMDRILILWGTVMLSLTACVPFVEEALTEVNVNFNDPVYRSVYNFQDSHQLDSLLDFADHRDPSYRYSTALAFASFQNPGGLPVLYNLLRDSITEVREAAAYSIGQLGLPESEDELIRAFTRKDTGTVNTLYNGFILEAIGKCGSESSLKSISTVTTYRKQDDMLLLGQVRAIYRFGLRSIYSPEGTNRMIDIVLDLDFPQKVRLVAANYLSRFPSADPGNRIFQLGQTFANDPDPEIRMALALAIGRKNEPQLLETLRQQFNSDQDYRVRCNILRALGNYPYIEVAQLMLDNLSNSNPHIAETAAQYFIVHGNSDDALFYLDYARQNSNWKVKSIIYEAILTHVPNYYGSSRANILSELTDLFNNARSPYEKAAYLKAICGDINNYRVVRDLGMTHEDSNVRTATIEALGSVFSNQKFDQIFRSNAQKRRIRGDIGEMVIEAMESGDAAMIEAGANVLSRESNGFDTTIDNTDFLDTLKMEMELPQDISTYKALIQAKQFLASDPLEEQLPPGFNNPIDWSIFQGVGDSSTATISTTKGDITINFFHRQAPGTIVNFIQLAMNNYYDEKYFHRVVPNFVAQGGCPRGDGYGSLDYTIRSELGPIYYDREGMVGMASAGNHTESTQFFITHSPAMHLDGKYTLFARVVNGMEVVHSLRIGDQINDVIINK